MNEVASKGRQEERVHIWAWGPEVTAPPTGGSDPSHGGPDERGMCTCVVLWEVRSLLQRLPPSWWDISVSSNDCSLLAFLQWTWSGLGTLWCVCPSGQLLGGCTVWCSLMAWALPLPAEPTNRMDALQLTPWRQHLSYGGYEGVAYSCVQQEEQLTTMVTSHVLVTMVISHVLVSMVTSHVLVTMVT